MRSVTHHECDSVGLVAVHLLLRPGNYLSDVCPRNVNSVGSSFRGTLRAVMDVYTKPGTKVLPGGFVLINRCCNNAIHEASISKLQKGAPRSFRSRLGRAAPTGARSASGSTTWTTPHVHPEKTGTAPTPSRRSAPGLFLTPHLGHTSCITGRAHLAPSRRGVRRGITWPDDSAVRRAPAQSYGRLNGPNRDPVGGCCRGLAWPRSCGGPCVRRAGRWPRTGP